MSTAMRSAASSSSLLLLLLCQPVPEALALDNLLGFTPGMGWNSDYCSGCVLPPPLLAAASTGAEVAGQSSSSGLVGGLQNEAFVAEIANAMHSMPVASAGGKTLQELGYEYVNMDASWDLKDRSPSGELQPDPKLWPHGLNATVDYVHSLGLKFGLYGDKGTKDCAGNPGSLGHEVADANFLAANSIDWWKEDSCFTPKDHGTNVQQVADYARMRDALNATGHQIWFALCGWKPFYADPSLGAGNKLGNSWRTGPDTGSGWQAVIENVENALQTSQWNGVSIGPSAAGGGWNDGSLLLNPGMGKITEAQHRSQFNLWCLLAMNLLLTGNLTALDPYALETWTNEALIAINQDPLGLPAIRVDNVTTTEARDAAYVQAYTAECGGEPEAQAWVFDSPAPQFLSNNLSATQQTCINVDDCLLKPGHPVIYDSCSFKPPTGGCCNDWCNERFELTTDNKLRVALPNTTEAPLGWCLVTNADDKVSAAPCQNGTAPGYNDTWTYSTANGQLADHTGKCLTNAGPAPPSSLETAILGRPLENGDLTLLFLNNKAAPATGTPQPQADKMECDEKCLSHLQKYYAAAMGASAGSPGRASSGETAFEIVDLWSGSKVALANTTAIAYVERGGASVVYRLTRTS